jgi:hypothetical protein
MNRFCVACLLVMTLFDLGARAAEVPSGKAAEVFTADHIAYIYVMQAAASPDVQAELRLTDDQFDVMAQIRADVAYAGRAGDAAEKRKGVEKAAKTIRRVLSAKQLERLGQIHLQTLGVHALLQPDVIASLKISDDQQKRLRAIDAEHSEKRRALQEDKSLSKEERLAKGRQLTKETMAAVSAVLAQGQREEFEKMCGPAFDFDRRVPPSPAYGGKQDYMNLKRQ